MEYLTVSGRYTKCMRITVFGASGKVGRQVVQLALGDGHQVKAFVHSNNPFEPQGGLSVVKGDIHDEVAVQEAVQGSEAVISCLGSWHTKSKDIVSSGMRTIIPVLEVGGPTRLITLTGGGAIWEKDKPSMFDRLSHRLLSIGAGKILYDGEEHLRMLSASKLDWTAIRSPVMTNGQASGYKLVIDLPPPWALIPRATVARCLVNQLSTRENLRSAPVIRRD